MKTTLLFVNDDPLAEVYEFNTVKEAQDWAENHCETGVFKIFTLYSVGQTTGITWKLQTDTGTNLREAKKTRHGTTWSPREIQALQDSLKAGTTLKKIAETLGRSYHATYCKAIAKKFVTKKSRK